MIRCIGALVLASAVMVSAQAPALVAPSVNLRLADVTLAQAIDALASAGSIAVQFDAGVPAEVRGSAQKPISFNNASMISALEFLAAQHGLAAVVVDAKTVRIQAAR
jgi:argininosuccinate synthase